MHVYVKLALLICLFLGVITCFVFKVIRNRIGTQMAELVTSGLFIAFTSQYAYLFSKLDSLSMNEVVCLLLFIFSIFVGVYKTYIILFRR